MDTIILIKGKTNFEITLDASTWIFDDRKLDLTTYFTAEQVHVDPDEKYVEEAGKFWSREIMEGAVFPPTLKTEKKFSHKEMRTGTFGMHVEPFIQNAEPTEDATQAVFITNQGEEFAFSIEEAKTKIFKFSQDGNMLENGPVYLLDGDGQNAESPIQGIVKIEIR
ncbi:hypothetical protein [Kurthia senegalensis]|uniref:hypothetical protein n=1 Tax=Kurthia senegalensis TaxID=1033740 RepID=UPI00028953D2|nr:hypothetical protein [Kurthia senegalensis]